ncbi:hypothetical protein Cgig2_006851 [Carnegiea gigantea]|uniref:DUF4283 domain-containing protein n=1 Tax=Carnegiea gigantea TaxID=171969 RepID=A0A9Q1Q8A7_9CARY|nr:hypothetical protein Cgig2_006851 [Carnegiea gigantea]
MRSSPKEGLEGSRQDLAFYKFILTYPTEPLMEEALEHHEELDLWLYDIQRWSRYEMCETCNMWLEVFGVPPRGWCWENFQRISDLWGRVITVGKSIARTDSFESMKLMITTDIFSQIEEEILLTLEDEGHCILVREVGGDVQGSGQGKTSTNELTCEPPKFEDIDDDPANDVDSHRTMNSPPRASKEDEAVQEMPNEEFSPNLNSNLNCEDQKVQENSSVSSDARTKAVIFTHNGDSKEARKIAQNSVLMKTESLN